MTDGIERGMLFLRKLIAEALAVQVSRATVDNAIKNFRSDAARIEALIEIREATLSTSLFLHLDHMFCLVFWTGANWSEQFSFQLKLFVKDNINANKIRYRYLVPEPYRFPTKSVMKICGMLRMHSVISVNEQ